METTTITIEVTMLTGEAIAALILQGQSLAEIGRSHGLSRERVRQILWDDLELSFRDVAAQRTQPAKPRPMASNSLRNLEANWGKDAPGGTVSVDARLRPDQKQWLSTLKGGLGYHIRKALDLYQHHATELPDSKPSSLVRASVRIRPDQAEWLKNLPGTTPEHIRAAIDLYRDSRKRK